ncbi:orotidine-5'-phosphate decarboxylase [Thermaerobacter marianensis DSM 12885]|uniref:Orotidine 5'-phosphate decarboxylase n=1 Tax=Thermaerobacter marianensis (strain ATCC 700841 / DSM 12885 / JCM 10246 / 7p75a) TaxID=644966 RepID=E6SJH2_THEM7|nr:orotidine-5'-phosphate decarboxylase [Thermaerobacter marianensis]ADU52127.1 orotidine-5'-phosphate decarboxylase [Thermaerobacter marianensis DSM 12885]
MSRTVAGAERLIVALDVADGARAEALVGALAPAGCAFKVGLELLYALGPAWIDRLASRGLRVFVDAKLHDIPNTVYGAARALAARGAWLLTVHLAGGEAMCRAAVEGAAAGAAAAGTGPVRVLGVTVLTSLEGMAYEEATGARLPLADEVVRRARNGRAWGLGGFVCAPAELGRLRAVAGGEAWLVSPGIRPAGSPAGDQRRVATPGAAIRAGADYLVVGRPVTAAADPWAALVAIAGEVERALAGGAAGGQAGSHQAVKGGGGDERR